MRGPAAAYALRRHPAPGGPPPPLALPRFLGTTRRQAKPHSKRIQQEAVSVIEKVYLMVEMDNLIKATEQRMVELEELQCQKKRVLKIYVSTLAGIASLTLYQANKHAAIVAQVISP